MSSPIFLVTLTLTPKTGVAWPFDWARDIPSTVSVNLTLPMALNDWNHWQSRPLRIEPPRQVRIEPQDTRHRP